MGKSDIKKFYERALEEGRFNSELFKELKNFSTENELKDFLKDKILPIAKEMGYDFSVEELLTYEKETVHKIKEYQLENVSGGVSIKNLALGGVVSLMALGAGIFGTMNSASAKSEETQISTVEENGPVVNDRPIVNDGPVEEVGPVIYDDQDLPESSEDPSEDSEEPPLQHEAQAGPYKTIEEEKAELIENYQRELIQLLEENLSELQKLIAPLHPEAQSTLIQQIAQLYESCCDIIYRIFSGSSTEEITSDYQERKYEINLEFGDFKAILKERIPKIRIANMQVNDTIRRIIGIFDAYIEHLDNKTTYYEDFIEFNNLMYEVNDNLERFNWNIAQTDDTEKIKKEINEFEGLLGYFQNKVSQRFPNPTVKNPTNNVGILRISFDHARSRGDEPQSRKNKKPRRAQLLERNKAIRRSTMMNTPFGEVMVEVSGSSPDGDIRIIKINGSEHAPTYTEIAEHLDRYYRENDPDLTMEMLYAILEYLELPAEEGDNIENVLERLNHGVVVDQDFVQTLDEEQRNCAAALCGILMVCESGQDRSENGGKRERGVIRALIKDVKWGFNTTPFANAFGFLGYRDGQEVEYEGYYTPSARVVRDKKNPRKILRQGGSVRGKVVVGKVKAEDVHNPSIPQKTLEKDLENTENLVLSSDSWE